ncbi:MAG TPA: FISUMP domain-containing protein, partial [Bacteroidales bacterium]|nr:FISUMP domain-containing protein [Bacteroidales bacterium]
NDGISETTVNIDISGSLGPYNFTYAINGISQTPVINYGGPMPFPISTKIPGLYSLVSVSNLVCPTGGIVSGSATVVVNPLPVPSFITGENSVCLNIPGKIYTTEAGKSNYIWTIPPEATITAGGTGTDNSVTLTWNTVGTYSINVNYSEPTTGCTAASPTSYPVTVNPLPTPSFTSGENSVCLNILDKVYTTQAGKLNYIWNIPPQATVTAGGTVNDNSVTLTWNTVGSYTISVNYTEPTTQCTAANDTPFAVTVKSLPVPSFTAGENSVCLNIPGKVYTTEAGKSNYIWTIPPQATITSGGTGTDNSITLTWNTAGSYAISVNYTEPTTQCTAASPTPFSVTVNPLPVPSVAGPGSVCLNSSSTYLTDSGMTNYLWTVSAGGNITSVNGTNSIDVLWSTTGIKTITVNYNDANGCTAAAPFPYSVTVTTLPVPALNGLNTICSGNSTIYTTDAGMNNYLWLISAGGTKTSGGSATDNTVTVTWNTPGAQSISVNYQMGPGCIAALPTVLPVTVKPRPSVTNAANSSVCSAATLSIIPQADLPGTTFSWTATGSSGNVSGFNSGSGFIIADHLVNTGFNIENVTYAVLPRLNGCDGGIANYIVTVNPVSDVTFTPNGQALCSGGTTNISLGSHVTGATFTWSATGSSGNITGFGPGAGNPISQTLTNTGTGPGTVTYTISPSFNNCPGTLNSVVVTVNPLPGTSYSICNDAITTTTAQPFKLKGGLPLGGAYSGAGVIGGIFNPAIAGTGNHTITYSYPNTWGCAASATQTISVVNPPAGFLCDNVMTDIRDNKQYPTVKIGTQCWMAANLNYGTPILFASSQMQRDNCTFEKYCFNDNLANCTSYGGLYQWDELMQYDNAAAAQGFCPPGWHVPTENEWTTLFNFYISNGFAGAPLKYSGYSGFNAFLSGTRFNNVNWNFSNFAVMFWSSTTHGPDKAWAHGMNFFNPSVSFYPSSRSNAFSVRCIKD